jgi:hypothetical protein
VNGFLIGHNGTSFLISGNDKLNLSRITVSLGHWTIHPVSEHETVALIRVMRRHRWMSHNSEKKTANDHKDRIRLERFRQQLSGDGSA